jgi:hypothetical protein
VNEKSKTKNNKICTRCELIISKIVELKIEEIKDGIDDVFVSVEY